MLARYAGLHRAVPALVRTVHPHHLAAAAATSSRAAVGRRYATISNVATPEAPQRPKPDQAASFASSAAAGVPYAELSVGEWRSVRKGARGGCRGQGWATPQGACWIHCICRGAAGGALPPICCLALRPSTPPRLCIPLHLARPPPLPAQLPPALLLLPQVFPVRSLRMSGVWRSRRRAWRRCARRGSRRWLWRAAQGRWPTSR